MNTKIALEELLRKEPSFPGRERAASSLASCAMWLSQNYAVETNLLPLDMLVLGQNASIFEYAGSMRFSSESNWRGVFRDWIAWLGDSHYPNAQEKIAQLRQGMEKPESLHARPYVFLGQFERGTAFSEMTFENGGFIVRYYANIAPTMPARLIAANRRDAEGASLSGGIVNLQYLHPEHCIEPAIPMKYSVGGAAPMPFTSLTRDDVLNLALDFKLLESADPNIIMTWLRVHDATSPSEDALPPGILRGLQHIAVRMESDPTYIRRVAESAFWVQANAEKVTPGHVKRFLAYLCETTGAAEAGSMLAVADDLYPIVANRIANRIGFRQGGLMTRYVSLREEAGYVLEYYGDLLVQGLRASLFPDDKKQTGAFFGWIGRHLMKQALPETMFSLDDHERLDADNKKELRGRFDAGLAQLKQGIDGQSTLENIGAWFRNLNLHDIPGFGLMECCNTPLELRAYWLNFDFANDVLQEMTGFYSDIESDFGYFSKHLLNPTSYEYSSARRAGFRPEQFTEENMPRIYFETRRRELRHSIARACAWTDRFFTSYSRFIKEEPYRSGYAYAQEYIRPILDDFPDVLRMPEAEIEDRFMSREPLLYDEHDHFREMDCGDDRYCVG